MTITINSKIANSRFLWVADTWNIGKALLHSQATPNKQTIWVKVCIYHANGAVTKVPLCTPRTRVFPRSSHVKCLHSLGRNINNLRYADDTTLMAEGEEELKSLLMRVKEESEKAGLKFSIQNIKIMASGPITSWLMGRKWKQRQTLFCWAPRTLWMGTAAMKLKDTCSLEEKLWQI